jgi:Rod binding domain-containing protein
MASGTGFNSTNLQSSLIDAQASLLLKRAGATQPGNKPTDDAKIEKSSRDFESILLGSWLQQAEQSFGSVPGGDEEEDEDAGKDQFQGIAMQSLAGSLTASGGIGIAKMIAEHLHKAADQALGRAGEMADAVSSSTE